MRRGLAKALGSAGRNQIILTDKASPSRGVSMALSGVCCTLWCFFWVHTSGSSPWGRFPVKQSQGDDKVMIRAASSRTETPGRATPLQPWPCNSAAARALSHAGFLIWGWCKADRAPRENRMTVQNPGEEPVGSAPWNKS